MAEDAGREVRGSDVLVHEPGNNTWDLAREYAARDPDPGLQILVAVGSADVNHQGNLEWMQHLGALGIEFERHVPAGVRHNVNELFGALGAEVEVFHDRCLSSAGVGGA